MTSIQIHLQGHDQTQIDNAARALVETLQATDAGFTGPLPLPSRDEHDGGLFHRRLIELTRVGRHTLARLQMMTLPGGVHIDMKT